MKRCFAAHPPRRAPPPLRHRCRPAPSTARPPGRRTRRPAPRADGASTSSTARSAARTARRWHAEATPPRPVARPGPPPHRAHPHPPAGRGGCPATTTPPHAVWSAHTPAPNFELRGDKIARPAPAAGQLPTGRSSTECSPASTPCARSPAFRPFVPRGCPASPPPRTHLAGQRPPEWGRRGPESGGKASAHTRQRQNLPADSRIFPDPAREIRVISTDWRRRTAQTDCCT